MIEIFEIWIVVGLLLLIADLVIVVRLIRGRGATDKSLIFADHQKEELLNAATGNPTSVDEPMEIANFCQVSQSVRYDRQLKENIANSVDLDSFEKKR